MQWLTVLISGAAGALIATALNLAFTFWRERGRLRARVMLAVVGWTDDTYLRVTVLRASKKAVYTGGKPYLSKEEYAVNTRELCSLLLRVSIPAQLAIAYGEGEELALLNQLREQLSLAARLLRRSKENTWTEADQQVETLFKNHIDPNRACLERKLLGQAGFPFTRLRSRRSIKEGPKWPAISVEE